MFEAWIVFDIADSVPDDILCPPVAFCDVGNDVDDGERSTY
jgi:hypothetical protein